MVTLSNGSTLTLGRDGSDYVVTYRSAAGMIIDEMICETFEDAKFALDIGPDQW